MKSFIVLSVLCLVALSSAVPQRKPGPLTHDRGCAYVMGQCYEECPEGTHSYTSKLSEPWHWQPTCDEPEPELKMMPIADYSACYCDKPTVRDTVSNKCVTFDQCPKGLKKE